MFKNAILALLFAAFASSALAASPPPSACPTVGGGCIVPPSAPVTTFEGILFVGQSDSGPGGTLPSSKTTLTGANYPTALMFAQGGVLTNVATPSSAIGGAVSLQNPPLADRTANFLLPMVPACFAIQQFYIDAGLPSTPRLCSTVWQGGQPLSSFIQGTTLYNNVIAQATAFAGVRPDLLPARTETVLEFIEGESGPNDNTYQSGLATLIPQWQAAIQAATRQSATPKIFLAQINNYSTGTLSYSYPGEADIALARSMSGVYLLGPTYFSEQDAATADGIHSKTPGRCMLGDLTGYVYKRVVYDGLSWNPLWPTATTPITGSGSTRVLHFQLPPEGGNLAWDTTLVPATAHHGFNYVSSNGVTLTSETLDANGIDVDLTFSGTPAGTDTLYYAEGPASTSDNVIGACPSGCTVVGAAAPAWPSARGQLTSPTTILSPSYRWGCGPEQYIIYRAVRFGVVVP